ncbi:MAG: Glu/Leu/Phe/Val dehydrogenase [Bacteroidia bacterium]
MMTVKDSKQTVLTDQVVLGPMSAFNHEQVVFCNDNETGLKSIIAIHNTVLGPALGGTRMWVYKSESEALKDVLRLSRGMTYKSACAGINLGGGKAVIIGDSKTQKTEALLRRFGKFVNSLGGKYITAEDVGMGTRDMELIHMETDHVTGLPESMGGSGDPSPVTAYGVFLGMKASAKERWGSDSLSGKKVAVQGIGHVGESLVRQLVKEGCKVTICDINEEKVKLLVKELNIAAVTLDEIYDVDMDIYAPCALGATLNSETLSRLKCAVICGAANNQLADETVHGVELIQKGMLYAPDYVVNAGGIINVYYELEGYNRQRAMAHAENIYHTTLEIFRMAKAENIPSFAAANKLAEKRIAEIGRIKLSY